MPPLGNSVLEQATTAFRPLGPSGEVAAHPAFWDLDEAGREMLGEVVERQRVMEAALDPEGLSTTARAVLARLGGR